MEIKEIKNIIYAACFATLTVVVSICGVVLTKKAYRIMSNCEKITEHAANVGEMIDDKQFVEDVKKDVKGICENHKIAAQELVKATAKLNETSKEGDMGYYAKEACKNAATFTARLSAPVQPGDMGYNFNRAANNLATFTNDAREVMHVAKEKLIGNKPNSSTPAAPSDENNNSGSNSQDATGDGSGNTESNPQAASDSEEVPILDRIPPLITSASQTLKQVKTTAHLVENVAINNQDKGLLRFTVDTRDPEVKSADDKKLVNNLPGGIPDVSDNQQASESNNSDNSKSMCVTQ